MSFHSVEKDEWLVRLQLFLNVRLRTTSFRVAARGSELVSVPLPVPNTQYIIDGVLWSVCDNSAWVLDAWLTIQNHLHSCSQRLSELTNRLAQSFVSSGQHATGEDEAERERLYSVHAAVQDVYVAFCVVDGLLRHAGGDLLATRDAIEKELPRLVADHMPVWHLARSQYEHDAVEDYRLLFLDLLRAWTATKLLRADTHRRLEEHVRHKLKTLRDTLDTAGGSSDGAEQRQAGAIRTGLRLLLGGAVSGVSKPTASQLSSTPAAVDAVRRNMREFVSAIFPHRRSEARRHRCAHCGAIFKNASAKTTHYRYHFYNRTYLTEEKIVRLPYPTLQEYISSEVDCGKTGNFIRLTENFLDVHRVPDKRRVCVRK